MNIKILQICIIALFSPILFASTVNLANVYGSSSQSSTYLPAYDSSKAIDDITTGTSWTHTQSEANAWWEVDLLDTYNMTSVTIFNRTDCCGYRLDNADIQFLDAGHNVIHTISQFGTFGISQTFASLDINAQFLRVMLRGTNYLSLAEVQVFGGDSPVNNVPIPAAVWLMGSGLVGLMGYSRKNKSQSVAA